MTSRFRHRRMQNESVPKRRHMYRPRQRIHVSLYTCLHGNQLRKRSGDITYSLVLVYVQKINKNKLDVFFFSILYIYIFLCLPDNNECSSSPCQNGGTCNNLVNMYTCTCRAGYTGTHCATGQSIWCSIWKFIGVTSSFLVLYPPTSEMAVQRLCQHVWFK